MHSQTAIGNTGSAGLAIAMNFEISGERKKYVCGLQNPFGLHQTFQ